MEEKKVPKRNEAYVKVLIEGTLLLIAAQVKTEGGHVLGCQELRICGRYLYSGFSP